MSFAIFVTWFLAYWFGMAGVIWLEVIFYDRILSANERALLVGYLNGRYGLGAK